MYTKAVVNYYCDNDMNVDTAIRHMDMIYSVIEDRPPNEETIVRYIIDDFVKKANIEIDEDMLTYCKMESQESQNGWFNYYKVFNNDDSLYIQIGYTEITQEAYVESLLN